MDTSQTPRESLAAWRASGRRLSVHDQPVAWYLSDEGAGPGGHPVLCIHGFPTAAWDWHRVWTPLASRHRLAAPDLLGFGYSAKPADFSYTISVQADVCEAVLSAAGFRTFHILAHDYGDTVAQELLARRCAGHSAMDGLQSVLFLNGGLFPEAHRPRRIQTILAGPLGPWLVPLIGRAQVRRSLTAVFGPHTRPSRAELEALVDLIEAGKGKRLMPALLGYLAERVTHRQRWVGALVDSPVPIKLLDGEADPVSGGHLADRWDELLPHRPSERLPSVGHWPQLEAPEAVLQSALAFFAAPNAAEREGRP